MNEISHSYNILEFKSSVKGPWRRISEYSVQDVFSSTTAQMIPLCGDYSTYLVLQFVSKTLIICPLAIIEEVTQLI